VRQITSRKYEALTVSGNEKLTLAETLQDLQKLNFQ
jgi:hypothetical protein